MNPRDVVIDRLRSAVEALGRQPTPDDLPALNRAARSALAECALADYDVVVGLKTRNRTVSLALTVARRPFLLVDAVEPLSSEGACW